MKKYIYILNFGDYFARLTAKKIRKAGGCPKIVSFNTPFSELKNACGFVFSGSPHGSIRIPVKIINKELFQTNHPIMGICLGAQLITRYFGGRYKNLKKQSENGIVNLYLDRRVGIFKGLSKVEPVLMMHEDSIDQLGENFMLLAHTDRCRITASRHKKYRWYTFQFHPELSPCGDIIFENFVRFCYKEVVKEKPTKKEIRSQAESQETAQQPLPEINGNGNGNGDNCNCVVNNNK